ncbi:tRNA (adenosine(37)-N6)-threonylcarbamoyltransferase complex dimerization subunit type 1 TsaB [Frankia sp. Mgl5]|uniref:tRNA (adenosine(37)-N6)-threonylcarbamoyltransferase complex dimerization subunit type 1 TsaB n=1 Tax=Frankia sp. Mgl5 TaxID=2933793 RepID=UPI00200F9511|nr:tRNA (adenosine(37)-N6)-threonylcarbamoyltransferase complex dimerization subunit type 1 TsaB [Frankia sp. Mgl5]MCK9925793.1 tRNA (adenosine(37)-N6)-threonylcarbamoyltransferase complex dimerization subunit type 1 TsaB [Frankia sp. Mgl5]
MLVLALDTSTAACAVALVEFGAPPAGPLVRASRVVWDARRHGELLAPMMRDVLAAAGVRPPEVRAVVVGAGPGPFTSLRVGMVTGAAFAAALGVPAYGVCSLDGIGAATTGPVGVITDARRREVFWARYQDGTRVGEPGVGAPATVAADLRAAGVERVTGPGAGLYPDAFAGFGTPPAGGPGELTGSGEQRGSDAQSGSGEPSGAEPEYPAPEVLARLVAADIVAGRDPGPLTPRYLRRPDAAEPRGPKAVTASRPEPARSATAATGAAPAGAAPAGAAPAGAAPAGAAPAGTVPV